MTHREREDIMKLATIALSVAAVVTLSGCAAMNQRWHENCTVNAKDVLYSGSDGNTSRTKRLTTSCGSFDVEDALSVGQFDSWDTWQHLEVGKTYDLKTGGPRIGFFSVFPVVIEVRDA